MGGLLRWKPPEDEETHKQVAQAPKELAALCKTLLDLYCVNGKRLVVCMYACMYVMYACKTRHSYGQSQAPGIVWKNRVRALTIGPPQWAVELNAVADWWYRIILNAHPTGISIVHGKSGNIDVKLQGVCRYDGAPVISFGATSDALPCQSVRVYLYREERIKGFVVLAQQDVSC
jgi:hypothetical protein